jgi:hypothetical protein
MGTVDARMRLRIALKEAIELAKSYRQEDMRRFGELERSWVRMSDRRWRIRRRYEERGRAVDDALIAMTAAVEKLR